MKNKISNNRIIEIKIERFRSIDNLTIELGRLTTLIGHNDVGKSNITRALNLFFNNETSPGEKFDFDSDFNKFSKLPPKKAKEIRIEVIFELPDSFRKKGKEFVKWRKVWRNEGFREDKSHIRYIDNKELDSYSKIGILLDRYFLIYVPAIKDESFFTRLLGEIYNVLASSGKSTLKKSGGRFNTEIQGNIQSLLDNLELAVGENDTFSITLPDNLRPIYENLKIKNKEGIPFDRRGDGIKIKHIPEMLEFITLQKEDIHIGGVAPHHIWIFEEPENNLEFSAAVAMAERLQEILHKITNMQILLTTHSPVFYGMSLPKPNDTKKHSVKKSKKHFTDSNIASNEDLSKIMGLMSPVVKDIQEKKEEYHSSPRIFVEGKTDEKIYKRAMTIFFPDEKDIKVQAPHSGGVRATVKMLQSWELYQDTSPHDAKSIALLDNDLIGKKPTETINRKNRKFTHWQYIEATIGTVRNLAVAGYKIALDLESLYPDSLWKHAKEKTDWLTKTKTLTKVLPVHIVDSHLNSDKGMENILDTLNLSENERLRVEYKFNAKGKVEASKYIMNQDKAEAEKILKHFKKELEKAISYLRRPVPRTTQTPPATTPPESETASSRTK